MSARAARVWVVHHCEVALTLQGPLVDEMLFFTASSWNSAARMMRKVWVQPGSWWRVTTSRIDDSDPDAPQTGLYSRALNPLKSPPFASGLRAAKTRCRKDILGIRRRLRNDGVDRKTARILRDTVSGMKRVLAQSGR